MTRTYDSGFTSPIPTLIRADVIAKLSPTLRSNGAFAMGIVEFPFVIKSYVNSEYELALLIDQLDGRSPAFAVCVGDVDGKRTGASGNNEGTYEVEIYCASSHPRNLVRGRLGGDVQSNADNTFDPGIEAMRELAKMYVTDQECPSLGAMGKGRKLYYKGEHHMITTHEWSVWAVTFEITAMLNTNMLRGATEFLESILIRHHIGADNMAASATPLITTAFPKDDIGVVLGDSNAYGQTDPGHTAPEYMMTTPIGIPFRQTLCLGVNEPMHFTDTGEILLGAFNGLPGIGYEVTIGQTLLSLGLSPRILKRAISGSSTDQWSPANTFGTSSPELGGVNLAAAWEADVDAEIAATGRKLGWVVVSLGGNDGFDSTIANNVDVRMNEITSRIWAKYGSDVCIIWFQMNASVTGVPFRDIVIAKQRSFAAACTNPHFHLQNADDGELLLDGIHFTGDTYAREGEGAAFAIADDKGIARRKVASVPTCVGFGSPSFGTGARTPRAWPGTQPGDTVHAYAQSTFLVTGPTGTPATWTPPGWTLKASGTSTFPALPATVQFAIFEKQVSLADFTNGRLNLATWNMVSTENEVQLFTWRGPNPHPSMNAFSVFHTDAVFGPGLFTADGLTTTADRCGIGYYVGAWVGGPLNSSSTLAGGSGVANLSEVKDSTYAMPDTSGGLIALDVGEQALRGPVGPSGVLYQRDVIPAVITVAMQP
jgi:hypothetical protein